MGTRSFPGIKSGRGVTLTPHPLPVPWSRKRRAIPLLPLWAVRPVLYRASVPVQGCTLPFYLSDTGTCLDELSKYRNLTKYNHFRNTHVAATDVSTRQERLGHP